jgi:hypothetical protein
MHISVVLLSFMQQDGTRHKPLTTTGLEKSSSKEDLNVAESEVTINFYLNHSYN